MARTRQRSKSNSTLTHEEKLRRLSRVGIQADPTSPRSVAATYYQRFENKKSFKYREHSSRVPLDLERRASKKQRAELKQHGFRTTERGVIVDGPRDKRRVPLKGSRVKVLSGGVVQTSVGQRRDYIYGFTRAEKKKFADNPEAFTNSKVAELMERFPHLRRKKQIRLQWGAYQATKDFSPNYFTATYFAAISPEERRKVGKKKAKPRADKLTGLHIVVHVPKKKAKKKRK